MFFLHILIITLIKQNSNWELLFQHCVSCRAMITNENSIKQNLQGYIKKYKVLLISTNLALIETNQINHA